MYIPEKLKLNKYQVVKLPRGRDIWKRLCLAGLKEPGKNAYTGDNEPIPDLNKTEMSDYLNNKAEYEAILAEEERKPAEDK